MKKSFINSILTIAAVVFCMSCSKENNETIPSGSTSQLEITVTDLAPESRVSLTEEAQRITLKWESSDLLNIYVVQGSKKFKASAHPLSTAEATATFKFNLSSEFNPEASYTVYGVVNSAFEGNSSTFKVTANNLTLNLASLQTKMPLYFKKEVSSGAKISTTMEKLGSVVVFNVNNTTERQITLTKFKLEKSSAWVFANNVKFDIETKQFTETASQSSIEYNGSLAIGGSQAKKIYGYIIPLQNQTSSDLKATLTIDGREFTSKAPIKGGVTLSSGKFYNFKVTFDGVVTIESDGITLPVFEKEDLF